MGSSSDALALIAGSSQMPLVVAAQAREQGRRVLAVAIRGTTSSEIQQAADEVVWLDWGDLPGFFQVLESWCSQGVTEAIMAGKVQQQRIYDDSDGTIREALDGLQTRHTDQLLGAVARVLEGAGIRLLESTRYLGPLMPGSSWRAGRSPTEPEVRDIEHGWKVAKHLGRVDIGQTVVVKDRAVVAVEAMEGTDACIVRAGELAGSGCVVVKVAKPEQDLRFDVPVVGAETLAAMMAAGATALAFEAGCTVVFDREQIEAHAREAEIAVVARDDG